ncbi:MAG TPA: S1C family serine protease [Acidimicrobiia bacterium]|nr:S1C family serine protease [Acidimicrobiia bacterium]
MRHGDSPGDDRPGEGDGEVDGEVDGEQEPGQASDAGHAHDLDHPLDHDDPAATRSSPPDRRDRAWVHPSELVAPASPPASDRKTAQRRHGAAWIWPAVAGVAGALVAVAGLVVAGTIDRGSTRDNDPATSPTSIDRPALLGADSAGRVRASVVAVSARDEHGTRHGSGVCIRHGDEVLTSARVVGDAQTVDIVTADGTHYAARVVGRDQVTDLALVALNTSVDMPAAELAQQTPADGARMWVMSAPSATAAGALASAGTVSSRDAVVVASSGPTTGGLLEMTAGTTAASVGGALVDDSGSVAGIVLGPVTRSDSTYAVPIAAAIAVAEQLRTNGRATHGALGLAGVDAKAGATVVSVAAGGPAARAGVRSGDVVVRVDGREVTSIDDVMAIVRSRSPGAAVELEVRRHKAELHLRAVLGTTTG